MIDASPFHDLSLRVKHAEDAVAFVIVDADEARRRFHDRLCSHDTIYTPRFYAARQTTLLQIKHQPFMSPDRFSFLEDHGISRRGPCSNRIVLENAWALPFIRKDRSSNSLKGRKQQILPCLSGATGPCASFEWTKGRSLDDFVRAQSERAQEPADGWRKPARAAAIARSSLRRP